MFIAGGSTILRDNTNVGLINVGTPIGIKTTDSFNYIDSPNTTSAITYKTQFRRDLGNGTYGEVIVAKSSQSSITLIKYEDKFCLILQKLNRIYHWCVLPP